MSSETQFKYAAYCVATKNDFCLEESIVELIRQGVGRVVIVSPITYWTTGVLQPIADLKELLAISRRTGAELRSAYFKARQEGGVDSTNHALYTEALYRNFAIESIVSDPKIDFVITLDADELWTPGMLGRIDSAISSKSGTNPLKVCLPCTPVIGVPGLPIEGALDSVLVATHRQLRFKWGRSIQSDSAETVTGDDRIIHFTATRKTLQEAVEKHKLSGHYTDPTYDFDGWIAQVLPFVKPGMKDVHMYKSTNNIWPLVRSWTPAELELIPASLRGYVSLA